MPQLTLVSNAVDYDLYERMVAASKAVTTVQSAAVVNASILPRSCSFRSISFPNIAANAGATLTIKDADGKEIMVLAPGAAPFQVHNDANLCPLIGILLRGSVNNNVVDVEAIVA